MNAFGYAGQQTINADGTVTNNPSAVDGTWTGTNGAGAEVGASSAGHFYESGMIG